MRRDGARLCFVATIPIAGAAVNPTAKLILALAAFIGLMLALALLVALALYYDLDAASQQRAMDVFRARGELLLGLVVLVLIVLGTAFVVVYNRYVGGMLKVAEALQLMIEVNRGHRIALAGPDEIKLLARRANAMAQGSQALARDLESKVAQAKSSVEEERNRLAALMSELSQGVVACNVDGRVLLYNERARQTLGAPASAQGAASGSLIGLGRSIFSVIDRGLIAHALETVQSRLEKSEAASIAQFVTTTRTGQLVRVQMAPVLAAPAGEPADKDSPASKNAPVIGGFVMMLDDITHSFEVETTRDMLLHSFTEGSRASLANIRAAVETLTDYPDCEPRQRERFIRVIGEEVRALSGKLDKATADYADSLKTRWPLEQILGADLIEAARRRIEKRVGVATKAEELDGTLWIKADGHALIQALTYLASRLKEDFHVREVRFGLAQQGRLAELDLAWSGPRVSQQTLYDWEMDPMRAGGEESPLTLHDVTERHGAEIVFIADSARQRALFRLLLPIAKPVRPLAAAPYRYGESRPEFYDFDLFNQAVQTTELDHLPLTALAYTVIDTETTGLDPTAGDEIVSIGAVRIVNNRLLRYETFEQLVDPGRPIAPISEEIHGISSEMLRGQPTIQEVLPQLHEFCAETVLVGHNAAFDMRFLQLKEAQTGVRFTQPVLDTLLLSEVIHPSQESHALEAIAARLGVTVVARHTALGDALVTGEVFLRMIPLLAAQGIVSLRQARDAAQKAIRAKASY